MVLWDISFYNNIQNTLDIGNRVGLTDYIDFLKSGIKFKNKDGKEYELILDGFDLACHSGKENRYGECNLNVLLPPTNGGAYYSKKSNRRKRNKRTKRTKKNKRTKRSSRKI